MTVDAKDRVYLGLDVGGTCTRWCLVDSSGTLIRRGEADAFTGHLFRPEIHELARRTLDAIARDAGQISGVAAGITGLDGRPDDAVLLMAAAFSLAAENVIAENDLMMAYRAAFKPGDGILVYGGTGTAAIHIDIDEQAHRAGGYGILVDDAGGGAWLGAAALRCVLRQVDRGEAFESSILGQELARDLPGTAWPDLRDWVYGGERTALAGLAPAIARAADHGDPDAVHLLDRTANELTGLGARVKNRVGDLPIALTGGITNLHPSVVAGFQKVHPTGQVVSIDAARAAAQVARERRG